MIYKNCLWIICYLPVTPPFFQEMEARAFSWFSWVAGMWSLNGSMYLYIWVFPKIVVPQNGWFMEHPMNKWMIWGYHYFWKHPYTVDGNNPANQLRLVSLSHYLQGFIHPGWCMICSINSMMHLKSLYHDKTGWISNPTSHFRKGIPALW